MPKSEIMPQSSTNKKYTKPSQAAPKPTNKTFKNPEAGTVDYMRDKQKEYGVKINQALPGYQDPFNGVDPLTALLAGINGGPGGSSGGGGRGGGGGSGSAAADVAARNAALDGLLAQQNGIYDQFGAQANAGFDQRQTALQGIQGGADRRLSDILGTLDAGAQAARGQTSQAYAAGDQRLQALMQEYQQLSSQRDAGANQTLGAFAGAAGGAQGVVNPSGGGVQDLLMAGRGANTMRGNAADELYAQRGNVYNGLGADSRLQSGQTFDALLGQLAQQRQAQAAAIAQQRAQAALQNASAKVG